MKIIEIFDSTLRDGEQAPGNSMNPSEKLAFAQQLEKIGVNTIEAGFPASSKEDYNAVFEISKKIKNCKIAALSRMNRKDIDITASALFPSTNSQIELVGRGSDINLKYKSSMNRQDGLKETEEIIKYIKKNYPHLEISFGIEDSTRASLEYLCKLSSIAYNSGAEAIVLADTVGCAIPSQFGKLVKKIRINLPYCKISVHCHNDLGLAVANSISAIENGVSEIQTTVNGIGERCGNTQLEPLVIALMLNNNLGNTNIKTEYLYETSRLLSKIIKREPSFEMPIVGKNSFSTEAGIHQQGILKNPLVYQAFSPGIVGRKQEFYLGKHSGKSGFNYFLNNNQIYPTENELEEIVKISKDSGRFSILDLINIYNYIKAK